MLVKDKGIQDIYFVVSHNRCVPIARERLIELHKDYGLKEVIVTNSIRQTTEFESLPFLSIQCLSDTLSRTINRIHYGQSVSEVFDRP